MPTSEAVRANRYFSRLAAHHFPYPRPIQPCLHSAYFFEQTDVISQLSSSLSVLCSLPAQFATPAVIMGIVSPKGTPSPTPLCWNKSSQRLGDLESGATRVLSPTPSFPYSCLHFEVHLQGEAILTFPMQCVTGELFFLQQLFAWLFVARP